MWRQNHLAFDVQYVDSTAKCIFHHLVYKYIRCKTKSNVKVLKALLSENL